MPLPNKTKIPVGTVLAGKYRVTREIGRGGMAAVYEAANVDIGKRVAIKVLAQELTTSAVVVERFLREARAAAAIRSPFICDIYDSGRLDDGRPFLVLELLEGDSLYERMTKIRWLDVETTITVVTQVCRGLTKAHAASIVHRDLKPENIFLTKDEEGQLLSKILDFGLAKFYAPMESDGPQTRLTREGAVFGTPAYMSPEQVRGQGAVDHRADLWALGCIVYECFTGRTVWSTEQGVAMTFAQIANSQLPRPSTYRPDLPESFTTWFDRALNRDITKRFQSAREFADDFALVFNRARPEISAIQPSPALSLPKYVLEGLENPFLSGHDGSHVDPSARSSKSAGAAPQVSGVDEASRRVETEADTRSAPRPSGPSDAHPANPSQPLVPLLIGSTPGLEEPSKSGPISRQPPSEGPASPRPSKLSFAGPESREARGGEARTGGSRSATRVVAIVAGVAVLGAVTFFAWRELSQPAHGGTGDAPSSSATASATPSADAAAPGTSGAPSARRPPVVEAPALPWVSSMREAQGAIAGGDLKQAIRLLKDAYDKGGGHGVPRTMLEHLGVATGATEKQACKLTGLARPRSYDLMPGGHAVPAGRPAIAVGPKGAIIAWTDAHEGGNEHAYVVALDEMLRNRGAAVDVTPEGGQVSKVSLERAGERFVLAYADSRGAEAGVHARLLDADGRIAGPTVALEGAKSAASSPAIAVGPNGFFAAWSEEADADSEDLFFRQLGPALELRGDAFRATDLVAAGPSKVRARGASIAVAGNALLAAFRLERDPLRLIEHLRLPLADVAKGGLLPLKKGEKKIDRNIGDMALVNVDKAKADSPSLACGGGACFLAWHGDTGGGAWIAYVDPASAPPVVRRHFSKNGQHPAAAVSAAGQGQVVWFETGKVLVAPITKDGITPPSKIARVSGDQPMPAITAGNQPGEWYFTWLDYETGHLEPYAARVLCK